MDIEQVESVGKTVGGSGGLIANNWWKIALLVVLSSGSGAGGVLSTRLLEGSGALTAANEPLVVKLDDAAVHAFNQRLDNLAAEVAALNKNMVNFDMVLRNNWDRYEQWEFAGELEARLRLAEVNVSVPRPDRRKVE